MRSLAAIVIVNAFMQSKTSRTMMPLVAAVVIVNAFVQTQTERTMMHPLQQFVLLMLSCKARPRGQ